LQEAGGRKQERKISIDPLEKRGRERRIEIGFFDLVRNDIHA